MVTAMFEAIVFISAIIGTGIVAGVMMGFGAEQEKKQRQRDLERDAGF